MAPEPRFAPTGGARVLCLDLARTLVVALALNAHALTTFGGWEALGRVPEALWRLVCWSITPTFVVLFGAMLELVAFRRLETSGTAALVRSLGLRSAQCYAGYVATVAAGALGGRLPLGDALAAAVLLGDSRFSNILKFYAIGMLLAIPLLVFRRRFGLGGVVLVTLAWWLAAPLLDALPWPATTERVSYLTAMLVGRPPRAGSISLLHCFVLVAAGMLIGRAVRIGVDTGRWNALTRTLAALAAVGAAVTLWYVATLGPWAVLSGYLSRRFRAANHPAYYAIGLLWVTSLLLALAYLCRRRPLDHRAARPLLALGQHSIFAYPLGNVLLNLWPLRTPLAGPVAIAASLAFPVLVNGLVVLRERFAVRGLPALQRPAPQPLP